MCNLVFLRHWQRDADSIPRLLLGLYFCTVQLVSIGTVTYFSIVLALCSGKWPWNETTTEIKVLTFSLKGGLRVFLSMLFTSCVGVVAFFFFFVHSPTLSTVNVQMCHDYCVSHEEQQIVARELFTKSSELFLSSLEITVIFKFFAADAPAVLAPTSHLFRALLAPLCRFRKTHKQSRSDVN